MIYQYGCPNRPPVYGGIPSGFTLVSGSDARMPDATRHGIVAYHDPLTPEQVAAYQLVPILTTEQAASMIADSLRKYASTYLRQPAPQFYQVVGQRLDRLGVAVPASREKLALIVRSLLDSMSG
jgi:hypothetical protein